MSHDFETLFKRVSLLETQERRIVEVLEKPDAFTMLMLCRRATHDQEVRLHRLIDSITKRFFFDGEQVDPAEVEQSTGEVFGKGGQEARFWFEELLASFSVSGRYSTFTDHFKAMGRYPSLDDQETKLRRLTEALEK